MRRQSKGQRGYSIHTPLEQIAKHGYKVGGGETFLGIDQTAEIHVYHSSRW